MKRVADLSEEEIERLHAENAKEHAAEQELKEKERKRKEAEAARKAKARAEIRKKQKEEEKLVRAQADKEFKAQLKREQEKLPPPKKMSKAEFATRVKRDSTAIRGTTLGDHASKAKLVVLCEGGPTLPEGTPKRKLLEHLKALGGKATVEQLSEKMGQPLAPFSKSIKPLLGALQKSKCVQYGG